MPAQPSRYNVVKRFPVIRPPQRQLRPLLGHTLGLHDLHAGLEMLERGEQFGKIAIDLG